MTLLESMNWQAWCRLSIELAKTWTDLGESCLDVLAYKLQHPQSPAEELSQCRKTYKITGSWQEAGGLQKTGSNQPMSVPERNRFVQAIQHEVGVAADMRSLSKFVREQIFYVFVHDFKDDKDNCLSAEGEVCQEFVES